MKKTPRELLIPVEQELQAAVTRLKSAYQEYGADGIVGELSEALFSGGKRMRPLLCCLGHLASGGKAGPRLARAAASLELLHTFAILHDDIMDSGTARRRRPTAQKRIAELHLHSKGAKTAERLGLSTALLAGDLALVASDDLFVNSGFAESDLARAWEPVSRMRLDAIAGQYLDLSGSRESLTIGRASLIARLKSGRYSVSGPLEVGAALAAARLSATKALESFGESLGEAFQIADDLSGMLEDPSVTGKDAGSDLAEGKPTVLMALAFEGSSSAARRALGEAWGNPDATRRQQQNALRALLETKAPERAMQRIRSLVGQAIAALWSNPSELDPDVSTELQQLAEHILQRAERAARTPGEKDIDPGGRSFPAG